MAPSPPAPTWAPSVTRWPRASTYARGCVDSRGEDKGPVIVSLIANGFGLEELDQVVLQTISVCGSAENLKQGCKKTRVRRATIELQGEALDAVSQQRDVRKLAVNGERLNMV